MGGQRAAIRRESPPRCRWEDDPPAQAIFEFGLACFALELLQLVSALKDLRVQTSCRAAGMTFPTARQADNRPIKP